MGISEWCSVQKPRPNSLFNANEKLRQYPIESVNGFLPFHIIIIVCWLCACALCIVHGAHNLRFTQCNQTHSECDALFGICSGGRMNAMQVRCAMRTILIMPSNKFARSLCSAPTIRIQSYRQPLNCIAHKPYKIKNIWFFIYARNQWEKGCWCGLRSRSVSMTFACGYRLNFCQF